MRFDSPKSIRAAGFEGFETIASLRTSMLDAVPETAGIYLILRNTSEPPRFLSKSPAGKFKKRDPTLPISELHAAWLPSSSVLYIGKAGGLGTRATLKSRLRTYLRHGAGASAAHWGGRAIWQLAESSELLVAWRFEAGQSVRDTERALIGEFLREYQRRPFANRAG
jgi:hypothetical protein